MKAHREGLGHGSLLVGHIIRKLDQTVGEPGGVLAVSAGMAQLAALPGEDPAVGAVVPVASQACLTVAAGLLKYVLGVPGHPVARLEGPVGAWGHYDA